MSNTRLKAKFLPTSLVLAGSFALFPACSSPAGSSDDSASTTAADTTEALTQCPREVPASGSACPAVNLRCSWGSDVRVGCRAQSTCTDSGWFIYDDTANCGPEPKCPGTPPFAVGGVNATCLAADLGATCVYGETAYSCAPCTGDLCTKNQWFKTVMQSGCPTKEPNLGSTCETPGLLCNYNVCADVVPEGNPQVFGWEEECSSNGTWVYDQQNFCIR